MFYDLKEVLFLDWGLGKEEIVFKIYLFGVEPYSFIF